MSWAKGGGSDWRLWRGSWPSPSKDSVPWRQQGQKGQQKGQAKHQKGSGKGKPSDGGFPSYDRKAPKEELMKEVSSSSQAGLITEVQRAINNARRLENVARKLELAKQEKAKQWQDWQEELKATYSKERARFNRDITRLEKDSESTAVELRAARANLRAVAMDSGEDAHREEPPDATYEADFTALLAADQDDFDAKTAEMDNAQVQQRALEEAKASGGVGHPSGRAMDAFATPARRSRVPAMTPTHCLTPSAESQAYSGPPAATDPYMASPGATTGAASPSPMRPKEHLPRQGVKEAVKPKHPIRLPAHRGSPSLAEKLAERRMQHAASAHVPTPDIAVPTEAFLSAEHLAAAHKIQAERDRLNIPAQVPVLIFDDGDLDLEDPPGDTLGSDMD